jgi:methionyl aminopeptidase
LITSSFTHTISRPLHPEDIINIDLTLFLYGYHGDTSKTFMLPAVDKLGRDLVEATREALELGIRACGPGKKFSGIGNAIE